MIRLSNWPPHTLSSLQTGARHTEEGAFSQRGEDHDGRSEQGEGDEKRNSKRVKSVWMCGSVCGSGLKVGRGREISFETESKCTHISFSVGLFIIPGAMLGHFQRSYLDMI